MIWNRFCDMLSIWQQMRNRVGYIMIEIAICDDEVYMTSEIEEMLHNLSELYNVAVEIGVFYDGATLVDYIEKGMNYDIIYLDIEMKQNGVEAARRIRKKDTNVLIIYVTSHESFAKEVFEVSAYRFITKPIDKKYLKDTFLVRWELFGAYLCIIDISTIRFITNYLLKILYIFAVRKELHTLLLKMEKKSVMKN